MKKEPFTHKTPEETRRSFRLMTDFLYAALVILASCGVSAEINYQIRDLLAGNISNYENGLEILSLLCTIIFAWIVLFNKKIREAFKQYAEKKDINSLARFAVHGTIMLTPSIIAANGLNHWFNQLPPETIELLSLSNEFGRTSIMTSVFFILQGIYPFPISKKK